MLNERQKKLYELLQIHYALMEDEYIAKEAIVLNLSEYYPLKKEAEDHNQYCYALLRRDIKTLKSQPVEEVEHIIISSPRGYKLAKKSEYKLYSERSWRKIVAMIKRQKNQDNKYNKDGSLHFEDEAYKELHTVYNDDGE
jgi:hypothetical protein